jgi:serine/threonine protein kinase
MSPEQARGEIATIGPATDVYSLGATLYRALSGVYPYDSDSFMQAIQSIIQRDPQPLREQRPDCPEELAEIVAHAMSRDSRARPTAEELGQTLDRFLEENDLLMPPAPANPKV